MVRPHSEEPSEQFWLPVFQMDKLKLEWIQRRATKMVKDFFLQKHRRAWLVEFKMEIERISDHQPFFTNTFTGGILGKEKNIFN